jgi:hypothetical protein
MKKQEKNQKKGGGIFGSSDPKFIKLLEKAKKSESNFIKNYQKYVGSFEDYAKSTQKHTANLTALDTSMPDGFDSFLNIFQTTTLKDVINKKKVDTSSPLLLRNYSTKILADKDDLTREHLWHQCNYVLRTKYAPEDSVLVTKLNIADHNKSNFTMVITGILFGKDNRRTINHNNYNAKLSEIKTNLDDIIKIIKKDVLQQATEFDSLNNPIEKIDIPEPLEAAAFGTPTFIPKADPIPDIYGVKAILDKPGPRDAKPIFGDEKPVFGQKKPDFGKPNYPDVPGIVAGKPNYPAAPGMPTLKPDGVPPIGEPKPGFMKQSGNQGFGNFGQDKPFRAPPGRDGSPPRRDGSPFKRDDSPPRRDGTPRKSQGRRSHNKRHSGRKSNKFVNKDRQHHKKFDRPAFAGKRSKRGSNRFANKRRSKRSGRPAGPPAPPNFGI